MKKKTKFKTRKCITIPTQTDACWGGGLLTLCLKSSLKSFYIKEIFDKCAIAISFCLQKLLFIRFSFRHQITKKISFKPYLYLYLFLGASYIFGVIEKKFFVQMQQQNF